MSFFKPLPPETAIRTRLFYYLGFGLAAVWFVSNAVSLTLALHELNESADSQMSELARALPYIDVEDNGRSGSDDDDDDDDGEEEGANGTADWETILLPKIKHSFEEARRGDAKDKHNGIAIWDRNGKLLLADDKDRRIPYSSMAGFTDTGPIWDKDSWRVVYYRNNDTGLTAAVAQRRHERLEMLWHIVWVQLAASLAVLPAMALLLHLAVRRSIRPLDALAAELSDRRADKLAPVTRPVPRATRPVVEAINRLLGSVQAASEHEKRFTTAAANELRSPLAALKVQTEVLEISAPSEQPHHLHQIRQSIDRAEHLINQLLTLARLDPEQGLKQREPVDWEALSSQVLQQANLAAREKHIRLKRSFAEGSPLPLTGDTALLQLMLRNLIDNAVRYSPEHSEVSLDFYPDRIEVRDHGSGIAPEHLPHIKERFYRPPGQNAQGSGLGLSIVDQIAVLHGLRTDLENCAGGGLRVVIRKTDG